MSDDLFQWAASKLDKKPKRVMFDQKGYLERNGLVKPPHIRRWHHGMTGTRIHSMWKGIIARCYRPTMKNYKWYGGKGVTVCQDWRDNFPAFHKWAMANGYRDDLEIDRIDGNGNYCPENCRFVTRLENNRSRDICKLNADLVAQIKRERDSGMTWKQIASTKGIHLATAAKAYHRVY